jgi:cytochrome d ubiquinol oxidase subunit I
VARSQPTKLEGLPKTTRGAPEHLLGWYHGGRVKYGIEVPHLLSVLAFHSWTAPVQALDAVPGDQRPPVNVMRASFQLMVGIGTYPGLVGVAYLVVWIRRKRPPRSAWFYRAVVLAGPLSVVALIAGWVVTEVGRQPWIVYRVIPTDAAVTGAHGIPIGYAALACSYVVVGGGLAWVLRRLARAPLELAPAAGTALGAA